MIDLVLLIETVVVLGLYCIADSDEQLLAVFVGLAKFHLWLVSLEAAQRSSYAQLSSLILFAPTIASVSLEKLDFPIVAKNLHLNRNLLFSLKYSVRMH